MRWSVLFFLAFLQVCCLSRIPPPVEGEATFWYLCETEGVTVECSEGEVVTWTLPIKIAITDTALSAATSQAATAWNQWMGAEIFRPAKVGETVDVIVVAGQPNALLAGITDASLRRRPVMVTMFGPYVSRADVIAHELGHVLGLAHDQGTPWSIMDGSPSWVLPSLTLADCRALARKYHIRRPPCLAPYRETL